MEVIVGRKAGKSGFCEGENSVYEGRLIDFAYKNALWAALGARLLLLDALF